MVHKSSHFENLKGIWFNKHLYNYVRHVLYRWVLRSKVQYHDFVPNAKSFIDLNKCMKEYGHSQNDTSQQIIVTVCLKDY